MEKKNKNQAIKNKILKCYVTLKMTILSNYHIYLRISQEIVGKKKALN